MNRIENPRLISIGLFLAAFALYANTLGHGFVLDDEVVLSRNHFVQQGISGIPDIFGHDSFAGYEQIAGRENLLSGGRYRPLSLAFFALLWQVFGNNALVFHLFSVLLFAGAGVLVYRLTVLLLKENTQGKLAGLLTALLFAAHPIHTEVVANIKSCDEQLALILGLGALYLLFKSFDSNDKRSAWASVGLFFAACFAKENALILAVVAPFALWIFRQTSMGKAFKFSGLWWLPVLVFIGIRGSVLGWQFAGQAMQDPMNNPFLQFNGHQWVACAPGMKIATIVYTLGRYLLLMLWPMPLTHDYYPFQIALQQPGNVAVLLSAFVLTFLLVFAVWNAQKRGVVGFGLLFFAAALGMTANIVFPVGTLMAERFLFLPSFGFCLALAAGALQIAGQQRSNLVLAVFAIISLGFAFLTIQRNSAWKSNETLFKTDITHAPNSAKLRNSLGTLLLTQALQATDVTQRRALLEQSAEHLKKAVALHPTYYDALLAYGACTFYLQQYENAVTAYRSAHRLYPQDDKSKIGLVYALEGDGVDKIHRGDASGANALQEAWQLQPDTVSAGNLSRFYRKN
ncbi:MAG: hypothetical protein WCR52_07575, partial [Bacteroidota bacterium]